VERNPLAVNDLLDPTVARSTARATTPEMLAAGMGATTFMPRRGLADPEIAALAQCFAHNDQIAVLPDTIQYLNERAADETNWLQALSASDVNTTLVWGPTMSLRFGSRTTCGRSSSGTSRD
jgi:hypothetical protein